MATIDFTDYVTEVPASWLNDVDSHVYDDTTSVHTAAAITNVPAGGIAATTVQAAIDELDTEKAPLASPTFTGTVTVGAISGTTGTFTTSGSNTTVTIVDAGANGANIVFTGNGATTPSKYIKVADGNFNITNNAYSANILTITDAGALSVPAGISGTTGTFSDAISGTTITGSSTSSYGVVAQGDTTSPAKAAFRIVPQDAEPTGANSVGDIYVTTAGVLKICTVAGTPGTWTSVGAQV